MLGGRWVEGCRAKRRSLGTLSDKWVTNRKEITGRGQIEEFWREIHGVCLRLVELRTPTGYSNGNILLWTECWCLPQIYVLKPYPQCDGIRKWSLWEVSRIT